MSDHAAPATAPTADELRALLREAEQALRSGGQDGEDVAELLDRLRAAVGDDRPSLGQLREEALRRVRQADELVRENPYYALGLAAGAGALIGLLVARSCRD